MWCKDTRYVKTKRSSKVFNIYCETKQSMTKVGKGFCIFTVHVPRMEHLPSMVNTLTLGSLESRPRHCIDLRLRQTNF